jgi:hypothetical protein
MQQETLRSTRVNILKFYMLVTYKFSEQTAVFAVYNIKVLVLITEVESVYSAVRTGR